jgi:hypothetical protein
MYMLSGCELIDTENISLPSQNMKFVGEWVKRMSHKLHNVVTDAQALVARNYHPPFFFYFLFTYLFSIEFLYFFIISTLFPHFNLFMSIYIQSYVNSNLHAVPFLKIDHFAWISYATLIEIRRYQLPF